MIARWSGVFFFLLACVGVAIFLSYPNDPGLVCARGYFNPHCDLRPGGIYHGFRIGMGKEQAFQNACVPDEARHFDLDTLQGDIDYPGANRSEIVRRPLVCAYRTKALAYDYWQIRSDLRSCAGLNGDSVGILFRHGKLSALWINCGGLVI